MSLRIVAVLFVASLICYIAAFTLGKKQGIRALRFYLYLGHAIIALSAILYVRIICSPLQDNIKTSEINDVQFLSAEDPFYLSVELSDQNTKIVNILGIQKFESADYSHLNDSLKSIIKNKKLTLVIPESMFTQNDTIVSYVFGGEPLEFELGTELLKRGIAKFDSNADHYVRKIAEWQVDAEKDALAERKGYWINYR